MPKSGWVGVLAALVALAGASMAAVESCPRDRLLLEISWSEFWRGERTRLEVGTLRAGGDLRWQAVPVSEVGDEASDFMRAFGWEDEEQKRLRASVASSIEALDLEALRNLYLQVSRDCRSSNTAQLGISGAQFQVSPSKSRAICQPMDQWGTPDPAGILVDLESGRASSVFCHIEALSPAWSPDGRYLAYGAHRSESLTVSVDGVERLRDPYFPAETLSLVDAETGQVLWRVPLAARIEDIVWARNSDRIAVLERSSRVGLWPWELVFASAGHPIPHDTLSVQWFERSGALAGQSVVVRNITYASGRIRWAPEYP